MMYANILSIALLLSYTFATETYVDFRNSSKCGKSHDVGKDDVIRLMALESDKSSTCNVTLNAKASGTTSCQEICYVFNPNTKIKKSNVSFEIAEGAKKLVVDEKNPAATNVPTCNGYASMTTKLELPPDYVYNKTKRQFHVILSVYNKCGRLGANKTLKFEEALKYLDGYHHGEEFQKQSDKTYLHGLITGVGLASIFFVTLVGAICYTRTK